MASIYSYVVRFDAGFAPNPFGEWCTLATCKPMIRRKAAVGDWVLGWGSVRNVGQGRLIYAMRVDDVLPLDAYGADPRFRSKIPCRAGIGVRGDNLYWRDETGAWRQRPSVVHGPESMERNLRGQNALASREFWYFGRGAPAVPAKFRFLIACCQGHRRIEVGRGFERFLAWLKRHSSPGFRNLPFDLSADLGPPPTAKPRRPRQPASR